MQDHFTRASEERGTATATGSEVRTQPSSSRMLTSYLTDIEQLLDEQQWDAALREALDLPQMVTGLADPELQTSAAKVESWCQQWVRPRDDRNAQGLDYERVSNVVCDRAYRDPAAQIDHVPRTALKRLRLRRHVRIPPRGFSSNHFAAMEPAETDAVRICSTLSEAVRRWYAHFACHDATVQSNLARLAVLR